MSAESISYFLSIAGPLAERGAFSALGEVVQRNWSRQELLDFRTSPDPAVRRAALASLAVTGSLRDCPAIAGMLGDVDDCVATGAEDALWSIWFRSGSPQAVGRLAEAVRRIGRGEHETAVAGLCELARDEGTFAEVHHQLGIALHSLDRFDEAEVAYHIAARLNPLHFAAHAALGHIAVQRGELALALGWYREALQIHPRLEEIRAIAPKLETALLRRAYA